MYKKNILFLLLLFYFLSSAAYSLPTVNETKNYYKIQGNTAKRLRAQMNSKSNIRQGNNTFDAYTSWYVSWRFWFKEYSGRCSISKVTANLDVKFTLPAWTDKNSADPSLQKKWSKYYQALVEHENGHKEIGLKAAKEIEKMIRNIRNERSCVTLEETANALGQRILDKYRKIERKYDSDTNHGAKHGAYFP